MPKPKYNMKPQAADLFDQAGLSQVQIASRAKLNRFTLNRKLTGKQPGTLGATAWSIARLYAEQCQISPEAAMEQLFERVPDEAVEAGAPEKEGVLSVTHR